MRRIEVARMTTQCGCGSGRLRCMISAYNAQKKINLLKISGRHSRYGFFVAILIPHQCLGCQMSFGCHSHLFACACYVLVFQIYFKPIVLVPTCNRIKMDEKSDLNLFIQKIAESKLKSEYVVFDVIGGWYELTTYFMVRWEIY